MLRTGRIFSICAFLFLTALRGGAEAISWTNPGSGNWNDAGNWSLNRVPTGEDAVSISAAGDITVTISLLHAAAGTLTCTEALVISQGRILTINGSSILSGALDIQEGNLAIAGGGVEVVVSGATTLNTGSLTVNSGSTLALPGLAAATGACSFNAIGGDIDASALISFVPSETVDSNISAYLNGNIDISGLATIPSGVVHFQASQGGVIDAPGLVSAHHSGPLVSEIAIGYGGKMRVHEDFNFLDGYFFDLNDGYPGQNPPSEFPVEQITHARLSLISIEATSKEFSSLTSVDQTSIIAKEGGKITLPVLTSAINMGGTYWTADGFIAETVLSNLSIPALETVDASGGFGGTFNLLAANLATFSMPALTTVTGAGVHAVAQASGILLINSLSNCSAASSTFQTFSDGEIHRPIGGCTGGDGEGEEDGTQSSDQDGNFIISLSELLRVIQFYNIGGLHCDPLGEDGYAPGPGDQGCDPHDSDYSEQDWLISLSELLRLIQFFNLGGYHYCPHDGTEDAFCPGLA